MPDLLVVANGRAVFIEMKSKRGSPSSRQRQIRTQLLAAGAAWFLAKTPPAALQALALANVPFKRAVEGSTITAVGGSDDGGAAPAIAGASCRASAGCAPVARASAAQGRGASRGVR